MQGTVGYALDRWDYRYPPSSIWMCNHTRSFNINLAIRMLSIMDAQLLSWWIFNACGNYFKGGYNNIITCTTTVLTWNVLWMIGLHILFGFTASQASPSSSLQVGEPKTAQIQLTTFTNPKPCIIWSHYKTYTSAVMRSMPSMNRSMAVSCSSEEKQNYQ